jgi:glycosyltransferase involved in cell wall biosynthesis
MVPSSSNEFANSYTITNPIVSVIMPCYNVDKTLDEAIQSLLQQTLLEIEILAIDDGSTDSTLNSLKVWAKKDQRLQILQRPHEGIIPALNAGLASCQAPFIARMDADDIAHPDRLAKQVAFLESHPDIAVVSCLVEGYPPEDVRKGFEFYLKWLNSLLTSVAIAREIYIESPVAHPSVVIRKSWMDQIGGYQDHGWPEDYDLWLRLHLAGAKFAKVPETLLSWREHPHRLTRTDSRYSVENFLRAKAHYLCQGPLQDRDSVIIWGAGQMGRRLSKHLLKEGAPLVAFIDIDPKKIGRKRRGLPIHAPSDLPELWSRFNLPVLLASVGSRGARLLIREQCTSMGLKEASDWWAVA